MPNPVVTGGTWNGSPYDINDKRINDQDITNWNTSKPKTGSLTLTTSWTDNQDGTYSQSVTITGSTANSKVNLQPDATTIIAMATDKVQALYISNTNGTLSAIAVSNAPTT